MSSVADRLTSIMKPSSSHGKYTLQEIIANSDHCHGLEFDCTQEATLVRDTRPFIDFNSSYSLQRLLRMLYNFDCCSSGLLEAM